MTKYEDHPLASVLPLMGRYEIQELAADIQSNGQLAPITLLEGKILDGRNRYRACQFVGIEPKFRDFNGEGDPVDFIVSANVRRRHLTQSQKAMVAAKLANLPRGDASRFSKSAKTPMFSQTVQDTEWTSTADAAKRVDVSTSTVEQAKRVLREAPEKEIKAVERGQKSVATVVKEIRKTKAVDQPHLDKTGYPIPDDVYPDWQRAEEFRSVINEFHRIKLAVEKAVDEQDLVFREIQSDTVAELKNIWSFLKCVLPYAICLTCQGRTRKTCTTCKQRGFVSEFAYIHWFAPELRELRERAIVNEKGDLR